MTFLAPWFLLGLLAVSVPLMLHLRRTRQGERIVFSTTQFFDEQFLRAARRARLQDLLLLLLRCALLALLALALAQPLVRTSGLERLLGPGAGARNVAIVIDDSASMAATAPGGSSLARAREAALALVDELSPARGDRVTVVLAGARETGPSVRFQAPTRDLDAVRRVIEEIEPSDLAADLESAIEAGAVALSAGPEDDPAGPPAEIFVLSDFQATAWPRDAAPPALGPRAGLVLVATTPAGRSAPNASVEAIEYGAARPMVGVPFTFRALVRNDGPEPQPFTLALATGGRTVAERELEVPAHRARIVRFTHRFTEPGWHRGHIAITGGLSGDRLALDNRRHFAAHVKGRVHVLAVNGAPSQVRARDELFFFRTALRLPPGGGVAGGDRDVPAGELPVALEEIAPEALAEVSLEAQPLVVLANVAALEEAAVERLERHVDRGGGLFIALGDRVRPEAWNALTGGHRLHGGLLPGRLLQRIERDAEARPGEAAPALDTTHPMLAGFSAGHLGRLADVRFTGLYEIEPAGTEAPAGTQAPAGTEAPAGIEAPAGTQTGGAASPAPRASVLWRDAAGHPLLLEKRFGRGRVMLFASTLDRDWTRFPLEPTYVPWLYRMIGALAEPAIDRANFVRTGSIVPLPTAATAAEAVRFRLPGGGEAGTAAYPEPDPRPGRKGLVLPRTERAGVYTVHAVDDDERAGEPLAMFAANLPPEASRLTTLEEAELEARVGGEEGVPMAYIPDAGTLATGGSATARHGTPLWNTFLWLALLVALVEPWLANRLSRRRAAAPPDAPGRRDPLPGQHAPARKSAA